MTEVTLKSRMAFAVTTAVVVGVFSAFAQDLVLDQESGTRDYYESIGSGYSRIIKTGAGEVRLNTAASGFSGEVVVQAGTLTVAHADAVGENTPVNVCNGATLHLNLPGKGQTSCVFPGHVVTIAGTGVEGGGALRYTNTGSNLADWLLDRLVLSADATVDCSNRWGSFGTASEIDLQGHTITRIGSGSDVEWVINGKVTAGNIVNTAGILTLQGSSYYYSPDLDPGVTIAIQGDSKQMQVLNVPATGKIRLGTDMSSKNTIVLVKGTKNHIGPLEINGSGTVYMNTRSQLTVTGNVTTATAATSGGLSTSGDFDGVLYLDGDVHVRTTYVGAGYLCMTSGATRTTRLEMHNSTTVLGDGLLNYTLFRLRDGAAFRQTGGVIQSVKGDVYGDDWIDTPCIGDNTGNYNGNKTGFFTMEGGEAYVSNQFYIAGLDGGVDTYGAFHQKGGLFNLKREDGVGNNNIADFYIGRQGRALFVQKGGTNEVCHTAGETKERTVMGNWNNEATMTVSGTGTVFRTSAFRMGTEGGLSTNILNISDCGTFMANRFRRHHLLKAGSFACVNANGGVMMPTHPWGWGQASATDGTFFARNPDKFILWQNGLVVDTSVSETGNMDPSTLSFAFDAPTGNGVESVGLPDFSEHGSPVYRGIMPIIFEDATGWGASAYAEYNFDTTNLTHIVVTSRGCDYSSEAKAYIESPDRKSRYECSLVLSDNVGKCGPLVKRGHRDLYLYGTNTITGGIVVEEGKIWLGGDRVVPVDTPLTVMAGATLDLANRKPEFVISSFTGPGTVMNGNLTMTTIKAKCADLFNGRAAHFTGNVTLADNAVFEITDAENLPDYKGVNRVVALTVGGTISGTPILKLTNSDGTRYTGNDGSLLILDIDGKTLRLRRKTGLNIIVR